MDAPPPMNPIDERDVECTEQLNLIRRGIMLDLASYAGGERLHVYVEQGQPNKDVWEMIISQKHIQFAALYLDHKTLKKLADFFGDMARIGCKIAEKPV